MGRPQASYTVDMHKWFEANKHEIVENGKVLPPTNPIWGTAYLQLNKVSNTKSIYTNALRWWQKNQVSKPNEKHITCDVSMMESSSESGMSDLNMTHEKCERNSIKLCIELSPKVWEVIKPIEKPYSRRGNGVRIYTILKPAVWSNVIVDEIAKKQRDIPCGWSFKTNKVYRSGEEFLTMSANCSTCSAILSGVILNEPQENDTVKLYLEIRGLDLRRHENNKNKNVKISGEYARKLYDTKKTATAIRREMIKKKAAAFQKPYGRMVTANAIRCGKYRLRNKEKLSNCPYKALEYLKWSHKYMNTIHNIGMDPFFAFFSSPDQMKLYKVYKKKNKYTKISCDATGGVANKLARPGEKRSGDIYLYTMVISDGFQVPVNSALSESHNANFIRFWLDEWTRNTEEIPNEFTCDMSKAILNAAARAFGHKESIANYIDVLFDLLQDENKHPVPPCFVRIDIAHFIKKVATCEAIRNSPKKVRDFYIRCVTLLMVTDDLHEALEHIFSVLVVATSSTEGNSETTGDPVPCELHKALIIRKITGESIDYTEHDIQHIEDENVLKDELQEESLYKSLEHTSVSFWLNNIKNDADKMKEFDDGDRDNIMFNLKFFKYFLRLCKLYPIWSCICCKLFKGSSMTSSSGNAESNFKVTKQTLGDTIPCSVDKLVQELIDTTDGQIIEASQNYIKFVCDTENDDIIHDGNNVDEYIVDSTNDYTGHRNSDNTYDRTRDKTVDCTLDSNDATNTDDRTNEQNVDCTVDTNDATSTDDRINEKTVDCTVDTNDTTDADGRTNDNTVDRAVDTNDTTNTDGTTNDNTIDRTVDTNDANNTFDTTDVVNYDTCPAIKELSSVEKWCRKSKRETKKSKYLLHVPHWNLNININKKINFGFLINGNMSLRVFKSKSQMTALKNTCVFDSIAQILAAAYAYLPSFRTYMENGKDAILQIAVALAKNEHMNKVNNMRAQLLSDRLRPRANAMDVSSMIKLLMGNTPSCVEVFKCQLCKYSTVRSFPFISVDINIFNNDFTKLNNAIISNFRNMEACEICNNMELQLDRQFKNHMFIEIPSSVLVEYSNQDLHRLDEIPTVITINRANYVLFGAIIFIPEVMEGDIGHYISVIKVNESWDLFDDMAHKASRCNKIKKFNIHAVFYIEANTPDIQHENIQLKRSRSQSNVKKKLKQTQPRGRKLIPEEVNLFQKKQLQPRGSKLIQKEAKSPQNKQSHPTGNKLIPEEANSSQWKQNNSIGNKFIPNETSRISSRRHHPYCRR